MSIWELLGLTPTLETNIIKRAYAQKLKIVHLEDDPAAFQLLREAYDQAIKEAKYIKEATEQEPSVSSKDTRIVHEIVKPFASLYEAGSITAAMESVRQSDVHVIADAFMKQVERIYENPAARTNTEVWKELLDDELGWQLSLKPIVSRRMLDFLTEHHHLPKTIWVVLNDYFLWTEQERELCEHYDERFVDYLFMEVNKAWELRYEFVVSAGIDLDRFIDFRAEAHHALIRDDLEYAGSCLAAAQELYQDDPDLLRLIGNYSIRAGYPAQALDAYNRLIEVYPADIDGFIHRGAISLQMGNLKQAFADYQYILTREPNHLQAMNGLARCYLGYDQLSEAKLLLEQTIEQHPFDLDSRIRLYEVNNRLAESIRQEVIASPQDAKLHMSLAQSYYDMEQYEACCEAIESIRRFIELDSEMYLLWGRALYQRDLAEVSLEVLNQAWTAAQSEGANGFDIFVTLGTVLLKLDQPADTIHYVSLALEMNPYAASALSLMAHARLKLEQWTEGIECADRAIEMEPAQWMHYSLRGLCHYELGNYREACEDHAVVVEHEYDFNQAWFRKGFCHLQMKEYDQAIQCFEEALAWEYDESVIYYYCAGTLCLKGDYEAALAATRKLQELNDSDGYVLEGDIYRMMGEEAKAKEVYMEGTEQFPDHLDITQMALYMMLKEGNPQEQKQVIDYMTRLAQDDGEYYHWVLLESIPYFLNMNMWRDVLIMAKAFMEWQGEEIEDDDAIKVWFYSGIAHYHLRLFQESIEDLERAYRMGYREEISIYLSAAYFKTGQLANALSYAEEACREEPDHTEYASYVQELRQQNKKSSWLGWFKKSTPVEISLPDKICLKHQAIGGVPKLHFIVQD